MGLLGGSHGFCGDGGDEVKHLASFALGCLVAALILIAHGETTDEYVEMHRDYLTPPSSNRGAKF